MASLGTTNTFIPATSWPLLHHDNQSLVLKQLPISVRVAFERVDTNFGRISQQLFDVQEIIPTEDGFEDEDFPYPLLVRRCPNLKVLDFNRFHRFTSWDDLDRDFYQNYPLYLKDSLYQNDSLYLEGSLYQNNPNIRSFKNISKHFFPTVEKYLKEWHHFHSNEPFRYLGIEFLSIHEIEKLYSIVHYRIEFITLPMIDISELKIWEQLIEKFSYKDIKRIDSSRFDHDHMIDTILSHMLKNPMENLKSIKSVMSQSTLDMLSKYDSITRLNILFHSKHYDPKNLIQFSNLKHVDMSTKVGYQNRKEFSSDLMDFLSAHGHRLISLAPPTFVSGQVLKGIERYCKRLEMLQVEIGKKPVQVFIQSVKLMKSLKCLILRSVTPARSPLITREEYENICHSLPSLITFNCVVKEHE